jgi:hypothetical protein
METARSRPQRAGRQRGHERRQVDGALPQLEAALVEAGQQIAAPVAGALSILNPCIAGQKKHNNKLGVGKPQSKTVPR